MRHIVAAFIVAVVVMLASHSADVSGQVSCSFVGGFARLREMIGVDTVGACIDDEHVSVESGNIEQQTTGGLFVWRQVDNVTAFTDGGTTWMNSRNGLQSRPNGERFAWELDPVASLDPSSISPPPAAPPPLPEVSPPPPVPSPEALPLAAAPSPSPAPAGTGALASATGSPQTSAAATSPAGVSAAALAATPTRTPTPTPVPAVTVKFTDKPDDVDAGTDAHFEVQTTAKKGSCSLSITYRDGSLVGQGAKEIDDDGRCAWTFNIPVATKDGKAKAAVTVSGTNGTASVDETFEVKEGDTVYGGNIELELESVDLPDDVSVGQEIKVSVDTNLKKDKGKCELQIAWPAYTAYAGEAQTTDDQGRCSWKTTVPVAIPAKGTANLTVVVRRGTILTRTVTKAFEVKK